MRDRVVIVGAGFGGLSAARELAGKPVDVTLVDRHNYHLFQPLLYQVATAGLDAQDIAHSVRGIFHGEDNVAFRMATATGVDWERSQLLVDAGEPLAFDWLVLAAGAETNTFGIDGVAEHAFTLKTLDDAVRLRDHVLGRYERADADRTIVDDGALTFVVVGAGPTGVELTGAFVELVDHVLLRDFRDLDVTATRIVLVEALPHALSGYSPPNRDYAVDTLRSRGVDVRLDAALERVTPAEVELADGTIIATQTVVWTAGVRAGDLAAALDLEQTKAGRIVVDPDLSVPGRPNAFVVGDLAGARDDDGDLYPQLAPVAMQQARHAVSQVQRRRAGQPTAPFHYVDKGTMATVGRHAAVAELPFGVHLRGNIAWLAWLFLHLLYLIGFRNRASVLLNWLHNYVTYDRAARLIVRERSDAVRPAEADDELVEEDGRLVIPGTGTPLDDETVRGLRDADQR